MDNISLCLTKAITELLQQNERRFSVLQSEQDAQTKQISIMQDKINYLEDKCQNLLNERDQLNESLERYNEKQEKLATQVGTSDAELGATRKQVDSLQVKLNKWEKLTTTIATCVSSLTDSRDKLEERIKKLEEDQNVLCHKVKRYSDRQKLEQQAHSNHVYQPNVIRSPSASSFLNHHATSSTPRPSRSQNNFNHKSMNAFETSLDATDDLSVLSDHADTLRRQVDYLNELQKSFERNSVYSDD